MLKREGGTTLEEIMTAMGGKQMYADVIRCHLWPDSAGAGVFTGS
jgi:hypothetical protein